MTHERAKAILNITVSVFTIDDVKRARKSRMFEVHPDRGGSNDKVQEVSNAYDFFLKNGTDAPMDWSTQTPPGARARRAGAPYGFDSENTHARPDFGGFNFNIDELIDELRKHAARSGRTGGDVADTVEYLRSAFAANRAARAAASNSRRAHREAERDARGDRHHYAASSAPRYPRLWTGKHRLKFLRLEHLRVQNGTIKQYVFEVLDSRVGTHTGNGHPIGAVVCWWEARHGFHPAREWREGEIIIATIDEDIARDILLTVEQVREQERVKRSDMFKGRRPWRRPRRRPTPSPETNDSFDEPEVVADTKVDFDDDLPWA